MTTLMATHTKEQDESDLVRQAVHDVEAFAELYRRNLTRVYRYHMAHVGNIRDAEDLTSQTFMAALEGIRSFRGTGSFAAWLFGIASKKRLMFFRRNGGRPEVLLEAASQKPSPDLPTNQAAHQRLQMESVSRALRQISAERAEALAVLPRAEKEGVLEAEELGAVADEMLRQVKRVSPSLFSEAGPGCVRGPCPGQDDLRQSRKQELKSLK